MTNKFKIALVALALAGLAAWWQFGPARNAKSAKTVRTEVRPQVGSIERTISATAVIQPQNRLEMKPPVAGRIDRILVKEGDAVTAGQTVALMSSTERAALLDAAKAKGADVVKQWEDTYKPIPLIAPIDGSVIVSTMQPGQTVTQADPVIVLSNRLIVQAQIDETDIGRVREGQPARISLDAYPQIRVRGEVSHIYHESTIVNNVTIYKVDVLPAEIPPVFRSGMSANVQIVEESAEDVLLLPADVVQYDRGQAYVWVAANPRQKPARQDIRTGLTDNANVEIVEGLTADDVVIHEASRYVAAKQNAGGTNPFAPQGPRRRQQGQGGAGGQGGQGGGAGR